jgi:hypothetical protein
MALIVTLPSVPVELKGNVKRQVTLQASFLSRCLLDGTGMRHLFAAVSSIICCHGNRDRKVQTEHFSKKGFLMVYL